MCALKRLSGMKGCVAGRRLVTDRDKELNGEKTSACKEGMSGGEGIGSGEGMGIELECNSMLYLPR